MYFQLYVFTDVACQCMRVPPMGHTEGKSKGKRYVVFKSKMNEREI
jgi:hypothetical protein